MAAGSGSRFRPLAEEVAALRGRGEQFNKISIPFELGEGKEPFTMLEWALAMGKCFTGKEGYQNVITKKPLGSFADIVMHYLSQKSGQRKIKDIVVLCGDNIFGNSSEEMLEYVVRTLNSGKQLGVVGVARKPHEVAGRFGVLDMGSFDPKTRLYSLNGFVEKPPIEVAKKMVNEEGNNAANTGMFVMGRESLEKLLKIIKEEIDVLGGKTKYIAKSATEPFDFAEATKWAQWLNGPEKCDVKIINRWEDVGEPQAYFRWLNELKNGEYLRNFSDIRKAEILSGLQNRVGRDVEGSRFIQFTPNSTSKTTGNVDGIKVLA